MENVKRIVLISSLFLIVFFSFSQFVYASLYNVAARDQSTIYNNVGEGRGTAGYNYVMTSSVGTGRHINSIYSTYNSNNWIEIGWHRYPNQSPQTFWAFEDRGSYFEGVFDWVAGGQNFHFKVAADTGTNSWWWIINGVKRKSRSMAFVKGYPEGGSEKNWPGESNYATGGDYK